MKESESESECVRERGGERGEKILLALDCITRSRKLERHARTHGKRPARHPARTGLEWTPPIFIDFSLLVIWAHGRVISRRRVCRLIKTLIETGIEPSALRNFDDECVRDEMRKKEDQEIAQKT